MRCKKHVSDYSSSVGVCASCLRDRLLTLIEQQSKSPTQFPSNPNHSNPNSNHHHQQQQQQQQQKQQPPPLIFPRSVSPYISRRKSEPIQRFYSTPQVNINPPKKKKQNSSGKFGLISKLFRSKSTTTTTSSSNSTITSHNSTVITCRNKGMSPENEWDVDYDDKEPSESSPARWATRPSPARVRPSPARAASMAFCLSPLVRASPARYFGGGGEKVGFSGEIRAPASGKCRGSGGSNNNGNNNNNNIESNSKPNLSNAASFCGNRSRKLADFGRLKLNR